MADQTQWVCQTWRMTPLETFAVGLLGGVVAAIVATVGTFWLQSMRHAYADRTRFIDLRMERYSTLLRESDEHVRILKRQHDAVVSHLAGESDDPPPVLGTTDPISHFDAEISLLARRQEVGEAAVAIYGALVSADRFAWDSGWRSADEWFNWASKKLDEPLAAYERARAAFLDAAKKDLGTGRSQQRAGPAAMPAAVVPNAGGYWGRLVSQSDRRDDRTNARERSGWPCRPHT